MTKPIWVACPEKMRDVILNSVSGGWGCPNKYGLEGEHGCPKDEDGDVLTCRDCWLRFFDFDITDGDEHDD